VTKFFVKASSLRVGRFFICCFSFSSWFADDRAIGSKLRHVCRTNISGFAMP